MSELIPMQILKEYSQTFPKAWRQIAKMREDRGKVLPWWPDWCYCPIAGSVAIVTEGAPRIGTQEMEKVKETPPGVLAAVAAWRVTKGIYQFDPDLLQEIIKMPLSDTLPAEVFLSLPEWAIWVDVPEEAGIIFENGLLAGFFAYLEYDSNTHRKELRITGVFRDSGQMRIHFIGVHIGEWGLAEGIQRSYAENSTQAKHFGMPDLSESEYVDLQEKTLHYLTPVVNMILYICSVNADFGESGKPQHPSRVPRRKGKTETAREVRQWGVGVRVGAIFRQAKISAGDSSVETENSRTSPRPHYRRAHWHHYWTGPKDQPKERKLILKWLSPIPVNIAGLDDEALDKQPAVIRPIKPQREGKSCI